MIDNELSAMNKFAKLVSELRKKGGLTQEQLAAKLNVTDKAVSRWECSEGYPDISQLKNLANIFNITVDELLSGEVKFRIRDNMKICHHCKSKETCLKEKWLEHGICQNSFHWMIYGIIIISLFTLMIAIYLITNLITSNWFIWQFPLILIIIYCTIIFIMAMIFSLKDSKMFYK